MHEISVKRVDLARRIQECHQRIANNDPEFSDSTLSLYRLLVSAAEPELRGKTRLIIVPDDVVWEAPFNALRSGDGKYLVERADLSYAPSLTVLREMVKARGARRNQGTLLAMGNPLLTTETTARSRNVLMGASLEPLPEAERMVRTLGQIYGARSSKLLIGADAREDAFKSEASGYTILQLATHGVINDVSPMYSHVVLSQGRESNEDGLLEAWEIMNLDLRADLAVLSACETARGRIGAGEGVIGLAWALFVAGCPTTVVSQWKVESSSTTELMLEFHRNLRTGATKSDALRRAELKLMKDRRFNHPFYWAGFIVVGDGGIASPRSRH